MRSRVRDGVGVTLVSGVGKGVEQVWDGAKSTCVVCLCAVINSFVCTFDHV